MAANYLQTRDWRNDPEVMKNIVTFYVKAKAIDNLANFFDSCSQIEIDEYRDYARALVALQEALKYLEKGRVHDKEAKVSSIQMRAELIEKFLEARKLVRSDPGEMVRQCQQLLELPYIDSAVRAGDIYALLIEFYYSQNNFEQCHATIELMRERSIVLNYFLDRKLVDNVYRTLGQPSPFGQPQWNAGQQKAQQGGGSGAGGGFGAGADADEVVDEVVDDVVDED